MVVTVEVRRKVVAVWWFREGVGLPERDAVGYTASLMYVSKLMRSGYALRVSVPRDVQRHLGVRKGDIIAWELEQGGTVRLWRISEEDLRRGRVVPFAARSVGPAD